MVRWFKELKEKAAKGITHLSTIKEGLFKEIGGSSVFNLHIKTAPFKAAVGLRISCPVTRRSTAGCPDKAHIRARGCSMKKLKSKGLRDVKPVAFLRKKISFRSSCGLIANKKGYRLPVAFFVNCI